MDESITKVLKAVQEEFPRNRPPRRQSSAQSGSSASNARKAASIPIADDRMFPTSDDLSLYTAGEFSPSSTLDEGAIAASPTSTSSLVVNPRFSTSPSSASGSFSGTTSSTIQEEASSAGEQTPRASHPGNLDLNSTNQYEATSSLPSYFTSIEKPVPASSDASTATSSGSGAQQQINDTTMTSAGSQAIQLSAGNSSKAGAVQVQSTTTNMPRSSRNTVGPSFIDLPPSRNQASGGFSLSSNKSDNILLTPGGDDIPFTFKRKSALTRPLESPEIVA